MLLLLALRFFPLTVPAALLSLDAVEAVDGRRACCAPPGGGDAGGRVPASLLPLGLGSGAGPVLGGRTWGPALGGLDGGRDGGPVLAGRPG